MSAVSRGRNGQPCRLSVGRSRRPCGRGRASTWLAVAGVVLSAHVPVLSSASSSPPLVVVGRLLGDDATSTGGFGVSRGVLVALADDMRLAFAGGVVRPPTAGTIPPPGFPTLDLRSRPITVPPGAVLTYAVGVEEQAWSTSPPITFTVTLQDDGGQSVLQETLLDPAGRPDDQAWKEVRVSLDAFAGRTVQLTFAARRAPTATGWALPLWGDPTVWATRPNAHRINVVLISFDTLRARSVSAYGCARETTPSLDQRIAARGVVFDDAMSTAPHTLASHLSLMTGVYPPVHGGATPARMPLDGRLGTLPQSLRAAGYETVAFTEDGWVLPLTSDRRGFARYVENKDVRHLSGTIAATFGQAMEWFRAHHDLPFFLFLHTYEVHSPYLPLPPYDRMFLAPEIHDDPPATALLRYEEEVRYADDMLAALLDELDALGLGTRTLVIVLADHGEEFYEHGGAYHAVQLYGESIDIPLLMRLPGVVPEGRRIETAVSIVDVAPTILDLLGAPPIPGADGTSLVPLLRMPPESLPPRTLFAETGIRDRPGVQMVGARTARHHCIARPDEPFECYDRSADPGMWARLVPPPDAPWLADIVTSITAYRQLNPPHPQAPPASLDADRAKKLRALGYLD